MSQTEGYELECYGLTRMELRAAIESAGNARYAGHFDYHGYGAAPDAGRGNQNNLWRSEDDRSLQPLTGPNNQGHEVISPILHGVDARTKLRMVCAALVRAGAKISVKCGVHVTLGISDSRTARMSVARKQQMLGRILEAYDYFYEAICRLHPPSRRPDGENHYYCENYEPYGGNSYGQGDEEHYARVLRNHPGKYSAINTGAFVHGDRIEFRQHAGSLNGTKIGNWAGLCVALIRWAKNDNHPNHGCDLTDFPPTLDGLFDMLALGSDLRTPLEARGRAARGHLRSPRYMGLYRTRQEHAERQEVA